MQRKAAKKAQLAREKEREKEAEAQRQAEEAKAQRKKKRSPLEAFMKKKRSSRGGE